MLPRPLSTSQTLPAGEPPLPVMLPVGWPFSAGTPCQVEHSDTTEKTHVYCVVQHLRLGLYKPQTTVSAAPRESLQGQVMISDFVDAPVSST